MKSLQFYMNFFYQWKEEAHLDVDFIQHLSNHYNKNNNTLVETFWLFLTPRIQESNQE